MINYELYFDGACNPNPNGEASFGFQLLKDKDRLNFGYGVIGRGQGMTDLLAEFTGLLEGLHSFLRFWEGSRSVLNIYGDSQFVIKQLNQDIPFRFFDSLSREQILVFMALKNIRDLDVEINIQWIPREQNQVADKLSKNLRVTFA